MIRLMCYAVWISIVKTIRAIHGEFKDASFARVFRETEGEAEVLRKRFLRGEL